MSAELWWVGKEEKGFLASAQLNYEKRIRKYQTLKIRRFKESKEKRVDLKLSAEGTSILSKLQLDDYLILMDEKGQSFSSQQWALQIEAHLIKYKRVIFLIGGSYGFSKEVYNRANERWAMSKLTFPHQMARLIFIEQYYRAMTILNNEKYHH